MAKQVENLLPLLRKGWSLGKNTYKSYHSDLGLLSHILSWIIRPCLSWNSDSLIREVINSFLESLREKWLGTNSEAILGWA